MGSLTNLTRGQKAHLISESGQTLVEILFALAVIALVLVAVVSRVSESVGKANFARNQLLATRFAQEGIEWARSQRDQLPWDADGSIPDFSDYIDATTYCLVSLNDNIDSLAPAACSSSQTIPGTPFFREVSFVSELSPPPTEGPYTDVTVTVTWTDRVGDHQSNLMTRLSKWSLQE